MEGLTEGRIVHYGKRPVKAAIVSCVVNKAQGIVDLHVFKGDSTFPVQLVRGVEYSEEPEIGKWHWIPKA